ncbi:MAG TPA: TetR/AcrR family transcriptional regulator [Myxococcales bacterium]|nr:TetR/AcrR family transcriptional regulator [Myxococcales bacterium]HIM01553.1 TetR/AcrR family transcriptional regulator [Myxococcales bacterium]
MTLTVRGRECFIIHVANKSGTPGRRTQAESERTKVRILERSERLFARRGFGGVSLRELAAECDVQHRTVQHHFGSKLGLYQAVLERWDEELESRLLAAIDGQTEIADVIDRVVEELFDYLLSKREWVTLTARASMGEELPEGANLNDQSWLRFMDRGLKRQNLGAGKVDLGLLLISVEGMLNNHILARSHYQALYGKDVTDPKLKRRTKEHLKTILRAVLADD